ncbi:unnamed protein product [Strongylus vulgaris]|uniref:Uncharacterized protein n=1 Tax=Strongylus vulgaris TaxID=40348 RepID=A0A3P7L7B6_STRVU|nr:unnamed protein product [Strongylus vulgaris]
MGEHINKLFMNADAKYMIYWYHADDKNYHIAGSLVRLPIWGLPFTSTEQQLLLLLSQTQPEPQLLPLPLPSYSYLYLQLCQIPPNSHKMGMLLLLREPNFLTLLLSLFQKAHRNNHRAPYSPYQNPYPYPAQPQVPQQCIGPCVNGQCPAGYVHYSLPAENSTGPSVQRTRQPILSVGRGRFASRGIHFRVHYSLPAENSTGPSVQRTLQPILSVGRGRFASRGIHFRVLSVHLSPVLLTI